MTLTPVQKAAAVDRADENIALSSGAGCGKTYVLARRFAERLRNSPGDDPLSHLVALTFTEKAALEMSQRVRRMLRDLSEEATGPQRDRLLQWLEELPEARISTIHSFCASLLRTYAVEAGVDPDFAVCADEPVVEQMLASAADQAVLAAVQAQRTEATDLLMRMPYGRLVEHVRWLLEHRTVCDLSACTDPASILARWRRQLERQSQTAWRDLESDEALKDRMDRLESVPCADSSDRLAEHRAEQLGLIRRLLRSSSARTREVLSQLNPRPGGIGSAKTWGDRETVRRVREQLSAVVSQVAACAVYTEDIAAQDEAAARDLAAMAALALEARRIYAADKRGKGLLDFTDLLDLTANLLKSRPDVRRAAGGQIRQLLIDECQDTDAFQVELLLSLITDKPAASLPGDGRLFFVGDAQQSIYRFRGAQVEVFRELRHRLGTAKQLRLDVSFRTHPAGVAFINHLFAPLLGDDYEPLEAHRGGSPPHAPVEILLAEGAGGAPITRAADAVGAQAALTAHRIAEMVAGGERLVWDSRSRQWRAVRYGDVAILFGRMTASLDYERQLARRNVPFYVVAGTGFFKQQEVYDLLNVLRVIDSPFDDIAFFGALRSSLFGLDDNVLMHVALSCRRPYLLNLDPRALSEVLSEADARTLSFACDLILRLHRRKDALGTDVLLERVLDATGYEATLRSRFQGRRMLGNVRRLVDMARGVAAARLGLAEFIARMNELVISESHQEQAAVSGEAEDVVRLMTIHKAKGLEFPVVFVPDLNAARRGPSSEILHRTDWGLVYGRKGEAAGEEGEGGRPQPPLSYRLARGLEDTESQREELRKLYVAASRHQDHLVFVAANWRGRNGDFANGDNLLRRIDSVLDISGAVDAGRAEIRDEEGRWSAAVRCVAAPLPPGSEGERSRGVSLLRSAASGDALARGMLGAARPGAPAARVGPLPPETGRAELAVTALSEFAFCPMLYRWRYELRVPPAAGEHLPAAGGLDALTAGAIFHRCMELLDFASPQQGAALARTAAEQLALEPSPDVEALAGEFESMLARFRSGPLAGEIAQARRVYRELDFTMALPAADVRGQIDLLYEDHAGGWHIVDYKSDRIGQEPLETHGRRYELQMLLYAAAAGRHLASPPVEAALYFLRTGQTCAFDTSPEPLDAALERAGSLAEQLVGMRRSGLFTPRHPPCSLCPCRALCRAVTPGGSRRGGHAYHAQERDLRSRR
jgi:ATP-dependent helicase/nuclease subunit A